MRSIWITVGTPRMGLDAQAAAGPEAPERVYNICLDLRVLFREPPPRDFLALRPEPARLTATSELELLGLPL